MKKVSWGILSTAKIGLEKVIPAMQAGEFCDIKAIASRDKSQAESAAKRLGIPVSYGSYEELLQDSSIEAIYIPLPNNLHLEWALKAIKAGKHVLCEKPIALNAAEATELQKAAQNSPQLKVMEAFMYRFHPQWLHVKKLVNEGKIGDLKTIQAFFSYYNDDPKNIRNSAEAGGGGLMDIGCYCISQSRFILDREPIKVQGIVEYDKQLRVDTKASAILDFGDCTASFICSIRTYPHQNFKIFGTKGLIEIEIPVNIPVETTRIWLETDKKREEILFEPKNQYTIQGDLFSKAILDNIDVPTSLTDAVNNMKVIEAIKESNETKGWVTVG